MDDAARDDEVLLLLRQVLIRGARRWRRGDVLLFADRIIASSPDGVREIPVVGIRRVARQRKALTGLRVIVVTDSERLEVRGLAQGAAATAQRMIADATRRQQS